jgi:hypothetical protein
MPLQKQSWTSLEFFWLVLGFVRQCLLTKLILQGCLVLLVNTVPAKNENGRVRIKRSHNTDQCYYSNQAGRQQGNLMFTTQIPLQQVLYIPGLIWLSRKPE